MARLSVPNLARSEAFSYTCSHVLTRSVRRSCPGYRPTCGTIPLKLLKIGALVHTSVCRIKFAMASGCPYHRDFALAHAQLINAAAH